MTVSKTATGESEASGNAYQDAARSRLDGRPTAWVTKADLADVRVRRWLKSAHRSFGSWARVAAVLKLSSKGKAQHIAEGRAPVTDELRASYAAVLTYYRIGRTWNEVERALRPAVDAVYDNRGREVKR